MEAEHIECQRLELPQRVEEDPIAGQRHHQGRRRGSLVDLLAVQRGSDQGGRYVLVVNGENVVEQRTVQTGAVDGDLRVIENGLKPDDRVVIAGLLRAIPGQKVDPQLQKIGQPPAVAK